MHMVSMWNRKQVCEDMTHLIIHNSKFKGLNPFPHQPKILICQVSLSKDIKKLLGRLLIMLANHNIGPRRLLHVKEHLEVCGTTVVELQAPL